MGKWIGEATEAAAGQWGRRHEGALMAWHTIKQLVIWALIVVPVGALLILAYGPSIHLPRWLHWPAVNLPLIIILATIVTFAVILWRLGRGTRYRIPKPPRGLR